MIAQELIDKIEAFAPKSLAEEGDPTGLQIGNPRQNIYRVMTTLDVRPDVVKEAIDRQIDFIWAHHEVMFFPAKNLDLSNPQNQMYADLIQHNIVVYASHTNLDSAQGGMNDWLAQVLGIENPVPLIPNEDSQTGLGRIGYLNEPVSVEEFARRIREIFNVKTLRVIANDLTKPIQKIAVLGGDGGHWWRNAQQAGADAYVTADIYYHVGHDILASDFIVIDPDHHMEAIANDKMVDKVQLWFGDELKVISTSVNTDPYQYI
ncbi:GTP cyclohydrolase 1 type 2 [Leuconostoc litchii]|uniref:GTP cyclohydrolase 1 type 2 homolog n=1 Tax=Leuconostoc litchii TaxID=1981069 RepID=A0A6P2CMB8_9LACO|nr:Nif3-like dinuclear metal center hexameric protein [Leuconostoc litchii]TYC47168.1 Nif3-like dinuclear metal center hexameric protein [Leuconostoc litchii]GMA69132.1 GTP cyclohydrolase 1 type 2 [Leuconostoc litchii]